MLVRQQFSENEKVKEILMLFQTGVIVMMNP